MCIIVRVPTNDGVLQSVVDSPFTSNLMPHFDVSRAKRQGLSRSLLSGLGPRPIRLPASPASQNVGAHSHYGSTSRFLPPVQLQSWIPNLELIVTNMSSTVAVCI